MLDVSPADEGVSRVSCKTGAVIAIGFLLSSSSWSIPPSLVPHIRETVEGGRTRTEKDPVVRGQSPKLGRLETVVRCEDLRAELADLVLGSRGDDGVGWHLS